MAERGTKGLKGGSAMEESCEICARLFVCLLLNPIAVFSERCSEMLLVFKHFNSLFIVTYNSLMEMETTCSFRDAKRMSFLSYAGAQGGRNS